PPQARAQWEAQLDTTLAALVYDESDLSQIQTAAILEEQLGLYADARRHMEDVLEKNQINPANWTIYGDIALKMRDYETAELAYAKSLELGVDQQVVAKLEQLWREHLPSQMENIEPLYQDAIAADGQRTFYLVRLAEFYAERGRFDEAVSHMKVAADLDKDNQELQDAYEDMLVRAREAKQESK
ncbi:hypothetical protein HYV72_02750, partial [Candidatus Uhrbacteria bacterium]|nr:hypothetical protein [Candidatus Uhrbacteria bacterium]